MEILEPPWALTAPTEEDRLFLARVGYRYWAPTPLTAAHFDVDQYLPQDFTATGRIIYAAEGWYWTSSHPRANPLCFSSPVLAYQHALLNDWRE